MLSGCLWWSRRESNPYLENRNLMFYPLNYGTNFPECKGNTLLQIKTSLSAPVFKLFMPVPVANTAPPTNSNYPIRAISLLFFLKLQ